ncbi:MAG: molybdenum cofactor guanylyltransferase MobA [Salaquimonas sp.]|jgi:molybdopterin-guanine dinucleotide biosynthesis protein A|nr:molybdenum cofactor guanylyltransferase MobA [Salaquimonas sp.]
MKDDLAKTEILGVILAGGLSRRMANADKDQIDKGQVDKALMELVGKPLVAHVRNRLAPQVANLILSTNGDPALFSGFGLPVQPDTIAGHAGPLAGILAGMRWAQANTPELHFIATAAVDTPFFPADCVARLARACASAENTIALAVSNGRRHPVFGLWPVALADDLDGFLRSGENNKVTRFAQRHRHVDVTFETDGDLDPFFNINTPQDFKIAQDHAKRTIHAR